MSLSFGTVGTKGEADNASVTPTMPSVSAGNIIVVFATARGNGTLACSGYNTYFQDAHASSGTNTIALFWKVAVGGDSNPTVTYSGGSAGHTIIAEIVVISGADTTTPFVEKGTVASNGSAANIGAITGIAITGGNAVIVFGHRSDDWTSVGTLSGDSLTWAEISDAGKSTLGTDAGQVWDYALVPSNTTITSKTFTVTGGNANPGMGVMVEVAVASNAGFKDTATRFRLRIQKFVDTATRFRLRATKYKDTSLRFKLSGPQAFKDTATRFNLIGAGFKNTNLRFRLRANAFKDTSTRFKVRVGRYVDTNTRLHLMAIAYKDTATRFRLGNQKFVDTAIRFVLIVPNDAFVDTVTRLRLRVTSWVDTATRFRLRIQNYVDTAILFRLRLAGYKDTGMRFRLHGSRIADTQFRFCLQPDPSTVTLHDTQLYISARSIGV